MLPGVIAYIWYIQQVGKQVGKAFTQNTSIHIIYAHAQYN